MKSFCFLLTFSVLLFACNNINKRRGNAIEKKAAPLRFTDIPDPVLKEGVFELEDESFGKVIELKGQEQSLDALIHPNSSEMIIKEDFLIILSHIKNNMFSVFSLPDFKLVKSFGDQGNGPNEFSFSSLVHTDEVDKICYIYDAGNQRLTYISNDFDLIRCSFDFPRGKTQSSRLKQVHVLSNKEILYASASSNGKKIFRFNPDSTNLESELNNLVIDKQYTNWAAFEGSFGVNKKKGRMVYAYNYFREIKFMNIDGTIEKRIVFNYEKPRTGDAVSMLAATNMTYYWKLYTCKESVYFTYSGNTPINWKNLTDKGEEFIYVEQYNWNGVPLHKYKLDHLGFFCVDEKRSKLYMISTVAENPFYTYDIPK